MSGAIFFGAAAAIGTVLDRIAPTHRALIIDFTAVPFLDSTAAKTIEGLAKNAAWRGTQIVLTGAPQGVRQDLAAHGAKPPLVTFTRDIDTALGRLKSKDGQPSGDRSHSAIKGRLE
jgi:SulP family sulfate permease